VTASTRATVVISLALIGLGAALLVRTALLGGGIGLLYGVLILVAGAARLRYAVR
jgi:hypothetical protein